MATSKSGGQRDPPGMRQATKKLEEDGWLVSAAEEAELRAGWLHSKSFKNNKKPGEKASCYLDELLL